MYLELTRDFAAEAPGFLQEMRAAQVNLASSLSTTERKIHCGGRARYAKCQGMYCYETDLFLYMMGCAIYSIMSDEERGRRPFLEGWREAPSDGKGAWPYHIWGCQRQTRGKDMPKK